MLCPSTISFEIVDKETAYVLKYIQSVEASVDIIIVETVDKVSVDCFDF